MPALNGTFTSPEALLENESFGPSPGFNDSDLDSLHNSTTVKYDYKGSEDLKIVGELVLAASIAFVLILAFAGYREHGEVLGVRAR